MNRISLQKGIMKKFSRLRKYRAKMQSILFRKEKEQHKKARKKTTGIILKIGNIFRADFGMFYQVTRNVGTLYDTTDVMDTYIFRMVREVGDMGLSSAADVLQSMVGFVLVVITNRITKKIDPDKALF